MCTENNFRYTEELKELVNSRRKKSWSKEDTKEALNYLLYMFYNNEVDIKYINSMLVYDLMLVCSEFYSWKGEIPYPDEFYGEIVEKILNYRLKMGIEVRK